MKYPIVNVSFVPYGYKHCGECLALHIDFESETYVDNEEKKKYIEYSIRRITGLMNDLFIQCSPEVISQNGHIIITFLSNVDIRMLESQVKRVLSELMFYTDNQLEITYGMDKVLMIQEGRTPGVLKANKIGLEYYESEEYKNKVKKIDKKEDSKGCNLLLSLHDYLSMKEL